MSNNGVGTFLLALGGVLGISVYHCALAGPTKVTLEYRTLEELKTFDATESERFPDVKRVDVAGPKRGHALKWTCRLSHTELAMGDSLMAEITVQNPSDRVMYCFSPPARGFFVANLQVWYRAAGEEKFRSFDVWKRSSDRDPQTGVPVRLGPGETRRWVSPVNHFSGVSKSLDSKNRLEIHEFISLGAAALNKPGKYEVVLRYINLEPVFNWQQQFPQREAKQRDEAGGTGLHSSDEVGPRLFGPFSVTVVERPNKKLRWAGIAYKLWETQVLGSAGTTAPVTEDDVKELDNLSDEQLRDGGALGDSVRMWRLGRTWWRVRESEEAAGQFEQMLQKAVSHLPANHPHRSAAELMRIAAKLERGMEAEVLADFLSSTDADAQLLLGLRLHERLTKKKP